MARKGADYAHNGIYFKLAILKYRIYYIVIIWLTSRQAIYRRVWILRYEKSTLQIICKWWPYILVSLTDRFARWATSNIYYGYFWARWRSLAADGRHSRRSRRVPLAALRRGLPRSCVSPAPWSRRLWSTEIPPNRICLPVVWQDLDL